MSMTKRYIGELQERAEQGDENAQETLSEAGLWEDEEAQRRREEAYFYSMMGFEIETDLTPEEIDEIEAEHLRWGI